jgi:hypothetical protein
MTQAEEMYMKLDFGDIRAMVHDPYVRPLDFLKAREFGPQEAMPYLRESLVHRFGTAEQWACEASLCRVSGNPLKADYAVLKVGCKCPASLYQFMRLWRDVLLPVAAGGGFFADSAALATMYHFERNYLSYSGQGNSFLPYEIQAAREAVHPRVGSHSLRVLHVGMVAFRATFPEGTSEQFSAWINKLTPSYVYDERSESSRETHFYFLGRHDVEARTAMTLYAYMFPVKYRALITELMADPTNSPWY